MATHKPNLVSISESREHQSSTVGERNSTDAISSEMLNLSVNILPFPQMDFDNAHSLIDSAIFFTFDLYVNTHEIGKT